MLPPLSLDEIIVLDTRTDGLSDAKINFPRLTPLEVLFRIQTVLTREKRLNVPLRNKERLLIIRICSFTFPAVRDIKREYVMIVTR